MWKSLLSHPFLAEEPTPSTTPNSPIEDPETRIVGCVVEALSLANLPKVQLKMRLSLASGASREIKFPFVLGSDTVQAVVLEMIKERVLGESAREMVAVAIDQSLQEARMKYENCKSSAALASQYQPDDLHILSDQPIVVDDSHPEIQLLIQRQSRELEVMQTIHKREKQLLLQTLQKFQSSSRTESPPPLKPTLSPTTLAQITAAVAASLNLHFPAPTSPSSTAKSTPTVDELNLVNQIRQIFDKKSIN